MPRYFEMCFSLYSTEFDLPSDASWTDQQRDKRSCAQDPKCVAQALAATLGN